MGFSWDKIPGSWKFYKKKQIGKFQNPGFLGIGIRIVMRFPSKLPPLIEDVTCVENKTREWNECYDLCIPFSKNDEFDGDIFECQKSILNFSFLSMLITKI